MGVNSGSLKTPLVSCSKWQFSATVVLLWSAIWKKRSLVVFSGRCCTSVRRSVARSCLSMPRLERFISFTAFFFGDIDCCSSGTCRSLTSTSVPVGQVSFTRFLSFSAGSFGTSYPQQQQISYFGGYLNIVWEPWGLQLYSAVQHIIVLCSVKPYSVLSVNSVNQQPEVHTSHLLIFPV